ncbi:MAG TPA: 3'-5' exonuclease [Phototrophicaceae bacterium]|nr:3'-5' exonuclease [Phototrophicaceae bacterium]
MVNNERREAAAERVAQLLQTGCVILDLETTGFVQPDVEIVEVAVVNHLGNVLLNTLVKPVGRIPSGASQVHGIFDEDVINAPAFGDIYPDLLRVVSGQPMVAYNYTFEQGILQTVCAKYQQPQLICHWHCAMREYAKFSGFGRFSKLTEACQREGVIVRNAHRALGDCQMTLGLMKKMAAGVR